METVDHVPPPPQPELDPDIKEAILAPKGEQTFDFLRDFLLRYTGIGAIMRRKATYFSKPHDLVLRYHSIEEMVLFCGSVRDALVDATSLPAMRLGNCFQNAFEVSIQRADMTYYEGWALMEHSIPTHHAWLVDANGAIHDPTWKTMAEQEGRSFRCSYLGVPIPTGQHIGHFFQTANANTLYEGEMVIPGVLIEGMSYYERFDIGEVSDEARTRLLKELAEHGGWTREEGSHIFVHSRTGRQWDGRRNCFIS